MQLCPKTIAEFMHPGQIYICVCICIHICTGWCTLQHGIIQERFKRSWWITRDLQRAPGLRGFQLLIHIYNIPSPASLLGTMYQAADAPNPPRTVALQCTASAQPCSAAVQIHSFPISLLSCVFHLPQNHLFFILTLIK